MASLGSFGVEREPAEQDTFEFFERTIRTNTELTEMDLADFMEQAADVDLTDPKSAMAAMGTVKAFLRAAVHPDDFDEFWREAKAHRQTLEDLMRVAVKVVEGMTGRPTMRPADSSDGPSETPGNSQDDLHSLVERVHPGRPDLQLAVLRAAGQRTG